MTNPGTQMTAASTAVPPTTAAHSADGHTRGSTVEDHRAALALAAATSSSPIRPIARSTTTMSVATVLEPACGAVSRIRMMSPPMLDGRKLLKNVATRNEFASVAYGTATCCAFSRNCQRHALASTMAR